MTPPLVFDLDDTLYLERDFVLSGFAAVGRMVMLLTREEGFAARCTALFESGERGRVFDRALEAAPAVAAAGVTVAALVSAYREHFPRIGLAPDVADYFARRPELSCSLITDGFTRTQWRKIIALGLMRTVEHVCVTGAWGEGFGKPHPRAFEEIGPTVRGAAGPAPVYVADNPAKDFLAPNRLGWITVQVVRPGRVHTAPPPSEAHAAAVTIGSFAELDAALAPLV